MTMDVHTGDAARAAIATTLERITDAWNAGDAAAYGAEFTEDADYVAFNGALMRGRAEIERVHRHLFEGPLRGSRLDGDAAAGTPPRFLRPDVAVVRQGGGVRPEGEEDLADDRASVVTLVLVEEEPGTWRVAAFQNTRRQPSGPASKERG